MIIVIVIAILALALVDLQPIRAWRKRRQHEKKQARWLSGYDYAAGALLRGTEPHEVAADPDNARTFGTNDEFDEGVDAALCDWGFERPKPYDGLFQGIVDELEALSQTRAKVSINVEAR